jgi:alpha-beta hydrolase superfamily lysophospholipase
MTSSLVDRLKSPKPWIVLASSAAIALLAAAGCTGLEKKERELVFRVEPGVARWYDGLPDGVHEVDLPVPARGAGSSAAHVHAWWWPAEAKNAPAVLYLHGSRWNLTGQAFRIEQLHELGFSVFAIDYRGFGKSGNSLPSEQTVYEDARIGWNAMTRLEPDPGRRFIYGHSLGGAIAVDLAAGLGREAVRDGHPPAASGLVVESSFTTLADMGRAFSASWLPVQWVLSQKFDAVDKIAEVDMPVIVLHGAGDRYVPVDLGRKLFDAAREPKRLVVVAHGTHNNSLRLGEDDVRRAIDELFPIRLPKS